MYRFEMEPSGIMLIEVSGFMELDEARSYLAELRSRLAELRGTRGRALVLVDGRQAEIQSAAVMEEMQGLQSILLYGAEDRAAYIVQNSLAKFQARRLASSEQLKMFLSPSAARTWLLAGHEMSTPNA